LKIENSFAMNIQTRKYKIIEQVMGLSENQLERIESTLNDDSQLDISLDQAVAQVKEGRVNPHSEVRKKYEKWL
jgi:hypothetical protein